MKKALLIIGIVILVLAIGIISFLAYMGYFAQLTIEEKELGPFTIAYTEHIGPYTGVGEPMMRLDEEMRAAGFNPTDGIGIYYDDPAKVPADELRSEVGAVIPDDEMDLIDENQGNFDFQTLERMNYLVAEFPIKNNLSYMLGPMKVYPAFAKYLEEKGIAVPDKGIEYYDMVNKKILFMMEY